MRYQFQIGVIWLTEARPNLSGSFSIGDTAQKMKFYIKDFFSKCDQIPDFPADLVTFTESSLLQCEKRLE